MIKPVVVIADSNEDYVVSLEEKFMEEFGEKVELEVITEKSYFEEYFAEKRMVEVLIVEEAWYFTELQNQNVKNIFVLQENFTGVTEKDSMVKKIEKYSSTNKIYQQVMDSNNCLEKIKTEKELSKTKVIVVYSPMGGVGKTTLALGIGSYIGTEKKVLYINAERMNTFQHHFKSEETIPNRVAMGLMASDDLYLKIKGVIGVEEIDYLYPFTMALSSLGLEYSIYNKIIEAVKEAKEYDYVIVDTDTVFDREKAWMIAKADKVVLVGKQGKETAHAMAVLSKNMDYDSMEKYFYICNNYDENRQRERFSEVYENCPVRDVVKHIAGIEEYGLQQLALKREIQKISLLVM